METHTKGAAPTAKTKRNLQFTADNLDNTAPVDKILESLQDKHKKTFAFASQFVRQRSDPHLTHFSEHYALTGPPLNKFSQDWDGGLSTGYFEQFAYKSLMPKMISKITSMSQVDPVSSTLNALKEWRSVRKGYHQIIYKQGLLEKYETLNDDVIYCPKVFVEMAAHMESKPDPYFDSSYNWYYAGNGNLQMICIDYVDYLIHSEFNCVSITKFSKEGIKVHDTHAATYDCGEGTNILETICSAHNIVALRTKFKIFILKIVSSDDKLAFETIKCMDSEIPFTSISFDSFHKNILYVSTLNCSLKIINLDRVTGRTVKLTSDITSLVDNWNAVVSSERTTYTHTTRNSIAIYDKRTNTTSEVWTKHKELVDETTPVNCNDISVVNQPAHNPLSMYFGTDHHLFLLDLRYNKFKPLQRWTHGMQCIPSYMSMCHFEYNKDIICLSSNWLEDTCTVVNYSDYLTRKREIHGVTMPYRPPSLLTTLHEAHQQGLCFDVYNPINERLCISITGSLIMEHDQNYIILSQNAQGDISSHVLYPEHMDTFMEDQGIQQLHEWSKTFKMKKKTLVVTEICNISDKLRSLKKVPNDWNDKWNVIVTKQPEEKFDEKEIFEAFDKEELDAGLLDIWTNTSNEDTTVETTIEQPSLNLHLSDSD